MTSYKRLRFNPETKSLGIENFMQLTSSGWFPQEIGEIGITREYIQVLKDAYKTKGLGSVIKHELKADLYSLYYRLASFFTFIDPTFNPDRFDLIRSYRNERHEAILTGKFNSIS